MNKGKIIVAGIGPGSEADITPAVLAAIQSSDVIIGYKYYFRFITHLLREGTECIDTGMKREQARAEQAFAYAPPVRPDVHNRPESPACVLAGTILLNDRVANNVPRFLDYRSP